MTATGIKGASGAKSATRRIRCVSDDGIARVGFIRLQIAKDRASNRRLTKDLLFREGAILGRFN